MDNGIFNGTGFLNAFEGMKPICKLSVGQMFLCDDGKGVLTLGLVISKDLEGGAVGFAYFNKVGCEEGVVIFEPVECNPERHPKLQNETLVLAIHPELKVDVSMEHCRLVNFHKDFTAKEETEVNRLGRLVLVQNDESAGFNHMGVITSRNKENSFFDTLRLVQTVEREGDLTQQVSNASFQFDEWHGVVGDQRVFSVRSRGLCKERQN